MFTYCLLGYPQEASSTFPASPSEISRIERGVKWVKLRDLLIEDKLNKVRFDFSTFISFLHPGLVSTLRWTAIEFFQEDIQLSMRDTIGAVNICQSYAMAIVAHSRYLPLLRTHQVMYIDICSYQCLSISAKVIRLTQIFTFLLALDLDPTSSRVDTDVDLRSTSPGTWTSSRFQSANRCARRAELFIQVLLFYRRKWARVPRSSVPGESYRKGCHLFSPELGKPI